MFRKDFRGNLFWRISFLWLDKLFVKGFKHKLSHGDLYPCPIEHCSEELSTRFNKSWQIEIQKDGEPDLKIALARTLKRPMLIAGIFQLIEILMILIQAILLKLISSECTIASYNNTVTNINSAIPSVFYTLVIFFIGLFNIINVTIGSYLVFSLAMQIRTICISALFKKVLCLQQTGIHKVSLGHVINLVSNDVYKFDIGILYWNYIWIAPILTLLSSTILLIYLGPIGLISVFILLAHVPLQMILGVIFGHFRYLQALTADKRIRLMDQVIRGMLVIKFYVWETPFIRNIGRIRRLESVYANLSGYTQSMNLTFYNTSFFIALFITYCISEALNEPISTDQLGLTFFTLNIIRYSVTNGVAQGTFSLRESIIALNRIQRVLLLQEDIDTSISMLPCTSTNSPGLKLDTFSASWRGTENIHYNNLVLKSITLTLHSHQLVAITGPVGAGKSSLLLSLINELPGLTGHISIIGKVSYASQEPWIFSGTIRDNILFGNLLDTDRYWEVINTCCLAEDIDSYTERDMTLIGERGVTLSGGQKARVSLARSVYHQADIYLLDDPMSALDARVGRELFVKCMRGLLRDKLILLITHHIKYARQADCIVVMREGEVISSGSYQELVDNNVFCREYLKGLNERDKQMGLSHDINEKFSEPNKHLLRLNVVPNVDNPDQYHSVVDSQLDNSITIQPLSSALTTEDYRPNLINTITYLNYFRAGGLFATILLLIFTVLSNGSLILAYWWMQSMARCSERKMMEYTNVSKSTDQNSTITCPWYFNFSDSRALQLLSFLTLSGSILICLRGVNFYYVVLQASRRLHNLMLRRIMHSPIRFFNTNPSGRILNRFSKDIGFLDEQLPLVFYELWVYGSFGAALLIANCIVQYILIIPTILLIVSTLVLRYFFLKTSTQVKRIESIARSPLYSHISLTLQGLSTIRALKTGDRVTRDLHYFQDEHSRTWYHYMSCQKWFGIRIELLTVLLVMFSLSSATVSRCFLETDYLINFTIPLLLTLPTLFQYVIRLSGDIDILMVSTDRILNYCNLVQERSYSSSPHKNIYNRPQTLNVRTGVIEYKSVCFQYSKDLPYSLVNVSLNVFPGEKIGIIGRTGAGKSSLIHSLFLMNEITSGSICIGGVDISSMNLYQHRKRLSVIPQDPFLFPETIRHNLDPFEEFTCDEIWDSLEKSHMKTLIESLPDQLLAGVEEDGHNFSAGERQLLCLARALLRRNDIIAIDEATANVDMHTDLLVQQAIRTHLSKCTVLTIAHRLDTVIDSDRIVVLDKATIVEVGIPSLLLRDEHSYLNKFITQLDLHSTPQYN